jgi:Uma2 family endonuclease
MATNPVKRTWTVEEYLAYELETGIKHEYIDGEIYAMSGGTKRHALIGLNVGAELRDKLRKSSCFVLNSEMRIRISDTKYLYPDATVVCGEAKFSDENETMLLNPSLVVEVLSESTKGFDVGKKSEYYRSLPSLQAYLLLEQDRHFAQLYTRHESGWLLREFSGLEAFVPLEAIGCNLALSEAYLNVDFDKEE